MMTDINRYNNALKQDMDNFSKYLIKLNNLMVGWE